jgi:hypothetical protein
MSTSSNDNRLLIWRKATTSNPKGECIQLAATTDGNVAMRNSRDPHGPVLYFTKAEVAAFLDGAKNMEFDDLTLSRLP